MKVVYCGAEFCTEDTFKRLVLVADEIAFLDRPSVAFGQWGTVGQPSPARQLVAPDDSPVQVKVVSPPAGPAEKFYQKYLEADLGNHSFVSSFLDGLRDSEAFARKFVAPELDYGSGSGAQLIAAISADENLRSADFAKPVDPKRMHAFASHEDRCEAVKVQLREASIKVSSALWAAAKTDFVPVSDDPFMCRLLAMRATEKRYVGFTPQMSAMLGLAIIQAVIPDEALTHLLVPDLIDYRKEAKAAYGAWKEQIEAFAVELDSVEAEALDDEIKRIFVTKVRPRIREYRNEMGSIRDRMFGGLLSKLGKQGLTSFPTLLLTHWVAGIDWPKALAVFATAATTGVVDAVVRGRRTARKNAMAYLVGISPEEP